MKRTNIHLADFQLKRLRELAARKGVSVADLVRRSIESYLERQGLPGENADFIETAKRYGFDDFRRIAGVRKNSKEAAMLLERHTRAREENS